MFDFKGKKVLVCGGSKGIGKASVDMFLEGGGEVFVVSRNSAPDIDRSAYKHITADLTSEKAIDSLKKEISDISPDILVNNSGGPPPNDSLNISYQDYLLAMNAHFYAPQKLVEAVIPGMKKRKFGRIINIVSISAKQPVPDLSVSNAFRSGVINWSRRHSIEFASSNITFNSVLPGYTDTERLRDIINNRSKDSGASASAIQQKITDSIPMKRLARPVEVANLICFLSSELASYITGQSIAVDGGKVGS